MELRGLTHEDEIAIIWLLLSFAGHSLSSTLSNGYDKRIYVWWTGTDSLNIIPLLRGHQSGISYRTAIAWGRAGLGSSHMERHNRKHGLVAATDNFNDGDTIQYRLLNTTMYTGYILYAKK